jgi:hypothetical protein
MAAPRGHADTCSPPLEAQRVRGEIAVLRSAYPIVHLILLVATATGSLTFPAKAGEGNFS